MNQEENTGTATAPAQENTPTTTSPFVTPKTQDEGSDAGSVAQSSGPHYNHETAQRNENNFRHHPPQTSTIEGTFGEARARCKRLADWINNNVPHGREKATALTKLEEVMFWTNAGISRNQ